MTVSKKRLSLCPEIISSVFSSWKKYLTDSWCYSFKEHRQARSQYAEN
jgi:hypothetical protein